jgi:hypothetical protein
MDLSIFITRLKIYSITIVFGLIYYKKYPQ